MSTTAVSLIADTVALTFAAVNIVLLLSILSRLTSVSEAPRAWNMLTLGMSFVIIHVSIQVSTTVNPAFSFFGVRLIASAALLVGFGFLFAGINRIWRVVYT